MTYENRLDSFVSIARASSHGLMLFLCRNFTYYSCWEWQQIPSLDLDDTKKHVASIIALSELAVDERGVSVVSLLFPLRMAGSHTNCMLQRQKVLYLLSRIYQMGLVVADRLRIDLQEYWAYVDSDSLSQP